MPGDGRARTRSPPRDAARWTPRRSDGSRYRRPSRRFCAPHRTAVMGMCSRLRRTFGIRGNEADTREELQFHLDMDVAEGHGERDARLRLGNATFIAEETRAMGIIPWLESVLQDARYGLRQLRKSPVLVSAIVLSLAIGIGANAAIFGLVD